MDQQRQFWVPLATTLNLRIAYKLQNIRHSQSASPLVLWHSWKCWQVMPLILSARKILAVCRKKMYFSWLCVPVATNRLLVVVVFAQQHMETCTCLGRERWPMDHEALLFLVLLSGTLPSTLRVSTTTLGQFQSGLKTILFRLAYGTWLGAFVTV